MILVALHLHCLCCQLSFMSPKPWRCGLHSLLCIAPSHLSQPSAMTLIQPYPGAFLPERGKRFKNRQSLVCMVFCVHAKGKIKGLQSPCTPAVLLVAPDFPDWRACGPAVYYVSPSCQAGMTSSIPSRKC